MFGNSAIEPYILSLKRRAAVLDHSYNIYFQMCSGIDQPFTFYIYQKTKFVQRICSDNWIFDFCQQNCRCNPRSKASKSSPKVSVSEPLAPYSCGFCF
ncbi:hypothetical protein Zmor_010660 [Zophobas morio]|uniref:Uncharacterized protein n=1 Tax=Zophobas morio TaxID=2755281 RepID=A0AA38IJE8_9CUCU|nr:hypothetical protein Zmor_010660 [Zophobas morio]